MKELKPCPFCGSKEVEITNAHETEEYGNFEDERCPCEQYENSGSCGCITIVCNKSKGGCGSSSGYRATIEQAIKAWNKRLN